MKYEVPFKQVEGRKVYLQPCPHQCFYESLNMYVVKKLGDVYCRSCKFYKGRKMSEGKLIIKCVHPEGVETIPLRK